MEIPRDTVWYIEARPFVKAPGHAPEIASMGSAVAVRLELLQAGKELGDPPRSYDSPRFRKYLLSCGHVVRAKATQGVPATGWGALLPEILCFRPTFGYSRTNKDDRRSGNRRSAWEADVHKSSPHGSVMDEVPEVERVAFNDWVLLEMKDERFQGVNAIELCAEGVVNSTVSILGYPGGSGVLEGRYWIEGEPVNCSGPFDFLLQGSTEPGTLNLSGADSREGMSGGGIFSVEDGALLGLHRASSDRSLVRYAIVMEHIRNELKSRLLLLHKGSAPNEKDKKIDLTPHLKTLVEALVLAFRTSAELARMVQLDLNESLDAIVAPGALKDRALQLANWAEGEGRLTELFFKALKREPGNPELKQLAQTIGVVPDDPTQDIFLGTEPLIPFFNRSTLRGHLRKICKADSQHKGMSLTGQGTCGKTYSHVLIAHVSRKQGMGMSYLSLAAGQSLDAACRRITRDLKLDAADMTKRVLEDKALDETVGQKFAFWLTTALGEEEAKRAVVVVDDIVPTAGTRSPLYEELVLPLFNELKTSVNFSKLLLVLIGETFPADRNFNRYVLSERMEALTKEHLEEIVTECAKHRHRVLSNTDLLLIMQKLTSGADGPYDGAQMEAIMQALQLLIERGVI